MLVVVVVELTVLTELLLQIRFLVLFSSLRNSPSSDEFVSDPPVESGPPETCSILRSLQSLLCSRQSVTGLSGPEFSEPDDTPEDVSGLFGCLICLGFHFVFMPRSKYILSPNCYQRLFKPCILNMIPSIIL